MHDNVEADEVLFYVRGNFGSRRGIEAGLDYSCIHAAFRTARIPARSWRAETPLRTEELAVMFDTQHSSSSPEESLALDDTKYPQSWLD